MAGLSLEETRHYVLHHIKLSGRADPVFEEPAFELIHQIAQGLPRKVNSLCIAALTVTMLKKAQVVSADHCLQASAGA